MAKNRMRNSNKTKANAEKSWVNTDFSAPGNFPQDSKLVMAPDMSGIDAGRYPDSISDSVGQMNNTQRKLKNETPSDFGY
jgi:hypothetical protein